MRDITILFFVSTQPNSPVRWLIQTWDSAHYRDVKRYKACQSTEKEIIAIYVLDSAPEKFVGLKRSLDSRNFPMWANRLQITDVGLK